MNPESLFLAVNTIAFITWLALIIRPRHPVVLRWAGLIMPLSFALFYCVLIALRLPHAEGGFRSLPEVAALFRDPWILLAGWVHYLAFDLLTGVWEARDAAGRSLPQRRLVPCLVLTFLFGPAGWLLYLTVRALPVSNRRGN